MNEGLNRLGALKNTETGETVVEMFGPPNALSQDDSLSAGLYLLSETIIRGLLPERRGGGLGGEFGYGADFENDIFMMHHYCWCEGESCLWCGGSSCLVEHERQPHRAGCYQVRLEALKRQFGEPFMPETYPDSWHVPYGSRNTKEYERAKRALCKELNQSYRHGNEVHCTCGVDAEWKAQYDACECDWHAGRGIYRFGRAADAPNFWHKPSGLRVSWYKWIGRDMEVNRKLRGEEWHKILLECYESLPAEAREKAKAEHDFENTPEYIAERDEAQTRAFRIMFEVMDAAHKECAEKGHDDPEGHCHRCGLVTDFARFRV